LAMLVLNICAITGPAGFLLLIQLDHMDPERSQNDGITGKCVPWQGFATRALSVVVVHGSNSDPLAFMWDRACSPETLSILGHAGALCAKCLA
jgi:hypothetical protein